jgi:hypothetical protein
LTIWGSLFNPLGGRSQEGIKNSPMKVSIGILLLIIPKISQWILFMLIIDSEKSIASKSSSVLLLKIMHFLV